MWTCPFLLLKRAQQQIVTQLSYSHTSHKWERNGKHLTAAASLCIRVSHPGSCAICWVTNIPLQFVVFKTAINLSIICESDDNRKNLCSSKRQLVDHPYFMLGEQNPCTALCRPMKEHHQGRSKPSTMTVLSDQPEPIPASLLKWNTAYSLKN